MITRSWCCHSQAYLVMIGIACSGVRMMFQSCSNFHCLKSSSCMDWLWATGTSTNALIGRGSWVHLNRRGRALQRKIPERAPENSFFARATVIALWFLLSPELSSRTPNTKFSGHRADSAWKGNSQLRFYCWLMGFANLRNNRTKLSNCTFYFVSYDCKMYGFISFGNNL